MTFFLIYSDNFSQIAFPWPFSLMFCHYFTCCLTWLSSTAWHGGNTLQFTEASSCPAFTALGCSLPTWSIKLHLHHLHHCLLCNWMCRHGIGMEKVEGREGFSERSSPYSTEQQYTVYRLTWCLIRPSCRQGQSCRRWMRGAPPPGYRWNVVEKVEGEGGSRLDFYHYMVEDGKWFYISEWMFWGLYQDVVIRHWHWKSLPDCYEVSSDPSERVHGCIVKLVYHACIFGWMYHWVCLYRAGQWKNFRCRPSLNTTWYHGIDAPLSAEWIKFIPRQLRIKQICVDLFKYYPPLGTWSKQLRKS